MRCACNPNALAEPSVAGNKIDPERFERRTGITAADLELLGQVPLFSGLSREALRILLADAAVQRFSRRAGLFLQGDPADRFYIVFGGWVKLFRNTADGHESVIAVFSRGDSLADAAVFAEGVFPVSAEVVDEARLLVIPAKYFIERLRENGDLALRMMGAMSVHLRQLVRHIEQLTARSSTERLAGFLCTLCTVEEGAAVVQLPFDKALVAGHLGIQPETFSRSLAKLRRYGVRADGGEVHIENVETLHALFEGASSPH